MRLTRRTRGPLAHEEITSLNSAVCSSVSCAGSTPAILTTLEAFKSRGLRRGQRSAQRVCWPEACLFQASEKGWTMVYNFHAMACSSVPACTLKAE